MRPTPTSPFRRPCGPPSGRRGAGWPDVVQREGLPAADRLSERLEPQLREARIEAVEEQIVDRVGAEEVRQRPGQNGCDGLQRPQVSAVTAPEDPLPRGVG